MIFKVDCFYAHEAGRQIAVLAEVKTYKWGKMLVIEEADGTGHSISCAEIAEANDNNWVEIGKAEWQMNFLPGAALKRDLDKFHSSRMKEEEFFKREARNVVVQ